MFGKERFHRLAESLHDKSAVMIINPNSGPPRQRSFTAMAEQIALDLKDKGIRVVTHVTEGRGHATELALKAKEKGAGLVLVKGGDGTVNEVIRGLMASGEEHSILGSLGGGTQNVWARAVHTPRNMAKAAHALLHGEVQQTDIGKITVDNEEIPFLVNAGFGVGAKAFQSVRESGQRGKVAIARHVFAEKRRYKGSAVRVTNNDTGKMVEIHDLLELVAINAGKYGILPLTDSAPDDEKLELAMMRESTFRFSQLIQMVPHSFLRNLSKKVPPVPQLIYDEGKRFTLTDTRGEPLPFHTDGEVQTSATEAEISIFESGIPMLIPHRG